ncbi:hypothetical protein [Apibacter mensalis]|uniref:hypothetical protein n=1 Tax=Apibacter mensalis TaxID=1586267 RepID=UPI0026EF1C02|nr:hypothetical protein [Apibacter mensalis]
MSKGINRIIISDEHISNGQIIKFPQLLNGCEVYGLIANGNWVTLSVEMDEKVFLDVEDKVKNKQIHSGIKWVYGKVYNLQKGGISWHGWYTDTNRNNKKDENEEWVNNKPVEQISKIDLHNVQGNYTIQKTIQIKFDNKPYDTPALSWVEPFLIHPELHFSKDPKGIFIVPIAEPKIYRTDLLINNSPFDRKLQIPLPKTEKESQENENVVYYGENLIISAHVCTLLIPESAEFTVIIDQKVQHGSNSGFLGVKIDSYQTIYEKKVNGLKPENDNFWSEDLDYELVSYLSQYFKRAELLIPLAIDKKPEDQKDKTKRTFSVTLKHIYQAYSATNTDFKKLYPIQQGYLTIGYTDMKNLLEIQNKEVDEYVEKAGDVLLQPNGEPCHYTWIKAHKEDEEITLFEEKKEGIKLYPIEIGLITGDVNPYLLTLSTNLKTEECKTQQHTKGADSVFYFPAKLSSEKQGIKIQKIDYSSVDLLIPYKYIRDHKALGMVNIFTFNYFWLNEKDVQKHVVMVDTCRYTIPVKINVYPDIEWEIKVEYACENPIKYRDSWVKMRQARVDDAVNKAQAGDVDGYDGNLETKFKIGAGVTYSNVQKEISYEFAGKIRPILETFLNIKQTVNKLIGGEKAQNDGFNFLPEKMKNACASLAAKLKRQPIMLEIGSPSVSFELNYKNVYNPPSPLSVVRQLEAHFKFSPFLTGKGTLDLIAIASEVPYIGRIVKAVDTALVALNIKAVFAISAIGEIGFEIIVSGLYHEKTGFNFFNKDNYSVEAKGRFGLEVELSAEGDWKVKTWLLWGDENSIKAGASAKASSFFEPTLGFGADKKGPYLEGSVRFNGIKIMLEVNAELNNLDFNRSKDIVIVEEPDEPIFGGKKYFNENDKKNS